MLNNLKLKLEVLDVKKCVVKIVSSTAVINPLP
jgi:hypothetical protein